MFINKPKLQTIQKTAYYLVICIALLVTGTVSFASCVTGITDDPYLSSSTIYGYVQNELSNIYYQCSITKEGKIQICNNSPSCGKCTNIDQASPTLFNSLPFENFKISSLSTFSIQTKVINTQTCLVMNTINGVETIFCTNNNPSNVDNNSKDSQEPNTCTHLSSSCLGSSTSPNSQVLLNFSGRMFQCVTESLHNVFFGSNDCQQYSALNSFKTISQGFQKIVFALLIMYVIGYGIKIALDPFRQTAEEYVIFVLKAVLVIYFTIGFQFSSIFANQVTKDIKNGMTDIALPLLTSLSSDLSQMVFSAARSAPKAPGQCQNTLNPQTSNAAVSSGLCQFDPESYPKGYHYYALFDMIDCRIGYFLGYQLAYDSANLGITQNAVENIYNSEPSQAQNYSQKKLGGSNQSSSAQTANSINNSIAQYGWVGTQGILTFFYVACAMILGSPILAIFNFLFAYLFFSTLIIKFVGTYIVYFIFIYAMVIISPIFIPMILFKQTKDMFYGWFKLTLSFAIQPAIMSVFITMMMAIYDSALYGDCTFTKSISQVLGNSVASFAISNASSSTTCSDSFGYQMYNLYTSSDSWSVQDFIFFPLPVIIAEGRFIPAAFQALLISFIIYKMTLSAMDFAAYLTGGIMINLQQANQNYNASQGGNNEDAGAKDKQKSGVEGGAADKFKSGTGAADKLTSRGGVK